VHSCLSVLLSLSHITYIHSLYCSVWANKWWWWWWSSQTDCKQKFRLGVASSRPELWLGRPCPPPLIHLEPSLQTDTDTLATYRQQVCVGLHTSGRNVYACRVSAAPDELFWIYRQTDRRTWDRCLTA